MSKENNQKIVDIFQAEAYLYSEKRFSQVFGLNNIEDIVKHFELEDWYEQEIKQNKKWNG